MNKPDPMPRRSEGKLGGFLRELLSGFPGGGARASQSGPINGDASTSDGRMHQQRLQLDGGGESSKDGGLRSGALSRMGETSERMESTNDSGGSRGTSTGMSDELRPVEKMGPGVRFRCLRFLNRGANGFVVLAEDKVANGTTETMETTDRVTPERSPNSRENSVHKKKKLFALKFIELRWTPREAKYIEREIINQFKLKHPHVIKLEEIFVTDTHLALVMEYADRGDLFNYVKQRGSLSESHARWFFQQIIMALDYCHRMDVVNRDVKMENILLSSNELVAHGMPLVKLSDFGFSKDVSTHSPPRTRLGTPMYIAPEVLKNKMGANYDGKKSDIWSAGVVLHVMLTGQYPFLAMQFDSSDVNTFEGQHQMMDRIRDEDYRRIPWLSKECNELIEGLLDFDPNTRLTTMGVMETAWFKKGLVSTIPEYNTSLVTQHTQYPRVTPDTLGHVRNLLSHAQRHVSTQSKSETSDMDE